jgi:hypothetical protein
MSKIQILNQKQILNAYRKKIAASFKRQQTAGQATIQAILEIGSLLIEAREYKDSLVLPYKEKVWKEFIAELGFSMSSVTRYIKIAEHPIIGDKKHHQYLPSSVYSLYEISSIEPKQMLRMIKAGSVYTEMGRSEISALKQIPTTNKIQSDKIDLLHIKIPKDLLQGDYFSILNELTEFLQSKGIDFEYGKEIAKNEEEERKVREKIERYVFAQAKKYFDTGIKKVVESAGLKSNLWKKGSKLSFKAKAIKVGYDFDDVSTELVSDIRELTNLYSIVQWDDDGSWDKRLAEYYAQGKEKYGEKLQQLHTSNPINDQSLQSDSKPFVSFAERRKKDNFTPVKFKDFKV